MLSLFVSIRPRLSLFLTLALLLAFNSISILSTELAVGQVPNSSDGEFNWKYANHNSWGTNYSPQTEINKDNVHLLEIKWAFPIPSASEFRDLQPTIPLTEGAMTPPLIVDGIVYIASNLRNIYAIDAETGGLEWENLWDFDWPRAYSRLPLTGGGTHVHAINYLNGLIYPSNVACSIRAIDADSGELSFQIEDICKDLEGNLYDWPDYQGPGLCGLQSNPPVLYDKGSILIAGMCGADLNWGGRSFVDGYDLSVDPPERIWRTFLQPPAEGDPEWALRNCEKGTFFSYKAWVEEGRLGIPCSEVPRENLINDWGVPKHYNSAVSELWGQIAVDEETGLVYLGTGNQAGWINQTYSPGPNLFASSIMALDALSGEIRWWYQTVPRDMVQSDAGWNTILARVDFQGEERKVVIKFTTTGLVWTLDAFTGEPLWIFEADFLKSRTDVDGVRRGRYSGVISAGPNTGYGYWNDPLSYFDKQEKRWLNDPSTDWFYVIPARAGEGDISFDPERQSIYVPVSQGWDAQGRAGPHGPIGQTPGDFSVSLPNQAKNTTIFSIDAESGDVRWSYFIDGVAFRGGVVSSGGVVYAPAADGFLYMLDADNGELLHRISFGSALVIQPTIGKTSNGESRLFIMTGGRGRPEVGGLPQTPTPGALLSYGLAEIVEPVIVEPVIVEPVIVEPPVDPRVEEDVNQQRPPARDEPILEDQDSFPGTLLIGGLVVVIGTGVIILLLLLLLKRKG